MESLPEWRQLYGLLGGAVAGLIGLLFVAVSVHAAALSSERLWHVRSLAVHALISYLLLLMLAALLLIPNQSALRLGLEIVALGVIGMVRLARFAFRTLRSSVLIGVSRNDWLRTFAVSAATAFGLVAIGVAVAAAAAASALDYSPLVAVGLLLTAVFTSWDLLLPIPVGQRTDGSN
ncbi:MAG: hypothetical protein ABSE69_00460 [Roseiarcus sp.]|jgi:hypothetical protein